MNLLNYPNPCSSDQFFHKHRLRHAGTTVMSFAKQQIQNLWVLQFCKSVSSPIQARRM